MISSGVHEAVWRLLWYVAQILTQGWRTDSQAAESVSGRWPSTQPSWGFLSGIEQLCQKSCLFPGWTGSKKWLSQEYKRLALLSQLWAALKNELIFRPSYRPGWGIFSRQNCSWTSYSAHSYLLPFPSWGSQEHSLNNLQPADLHLRLRLPDQVLRK